MQYKIIDNGYIQAIGTGSPPPNGEAIERPEFNHLLEVMQSRPVPEPGYGFRLTADLIWEQYEIPAVDDSEEEATEDDLLDAMRELGVEV